MAWTAPKTWVVGELATAAMLNSFLRDNLNFLRAGAACRFRRSTTQSISNNSDTDLASFDVTDFDTEGTMHNGSFPNWIFLSRPGLWHIGAACDFATNSTGKRYLQLTIFRTATGTGKVFSRVEVNAFASQPTSLAVSAPINAQPNDFVAASVLQTSGGALSTVQANKSRPCFWAVWLGQ